MNYFNLMPYLLLIVSIVLFAIALIVLIQRKPLIFKSRWILLILILCILPQIFMSVQTAVKNSSFMEILPILMISIFIIILSVMANGFYVFGVNGLDFKQLIIECLNDKNYKYEQTKSTIKIKNPEIELYVAIRPSIGTANIKYKGKGNPVVLNDIIMQLKTKEIKANYFLPVFYLLFGVIFMILSVSVIFN